MFIFAEWTKKHISAAFFETNIYIYIYIDTHTHTHTHTHSTFLLIHWASFALLSIYIYPHSLLPFMRYVYRPRVSLQNELLKTINTQKPQRYHDPCIIMAKSMKSWSSIDIVSSKKKKRWFVINYFMVHGSFCLRVN